MSESNWTDISNEFKKACSSLEIGELFKEEGFSLFEAMSAIEMMDPKMDAGLLSNKSKRKVSSIDEAIEKDLLKIREISIEDKIAIIDQTYCHLFTWLDGTSLAQTVFTNLYVHNTDIVEDKLMKWFHVTILKMVDSMRNKIMNACVFEEEDFQSMHYGFKFANEISDSVCATNLRNVEDECAKYLRNLKSQQNPDSKIQIDLAAGILARSKLTRALYQLIQLLNENTENNVDEIVKYCNQARENLKIIEETHDLGTKLQITEDSNIPVLMGFEASINQRLLPPTFPRHIKIHTFESTVKEFKRIIEGIEKSLKVLKLNNMHQIFNFIIQLDSDHTLSVLNRSIAQQIILPSNSIQKLLKVKELVRDTVKQFIEPPSMHTKCFLSSQPLVKQLLDNFFTKCSQVFVSLLQTAGHNRARQREKLGFLMEDFTALQEESTNLDHLLNTMLLQQKTQHISHIGYYRTWVVYNSLNIITQYLLNGFELELYSTYEFHYIYWFLGELVYGWLVSNLSQVEQCLNVALILNESGKKDKSKAKKKGKTMVEREIQLAKAHRFMCRAFYAAMKAFDLESKVTKPSEEFNDEELRYYNRFLPFKAYTNYAQFKERDLQLLREFNNDPLKLYLCAQEQFEKAKNLYEELNDLNTTACAKVAKTNFVIMRLLSSGMKKLSQIEYDFSQHTHYPILKI